MRNNFFTKIISIAAVGLLTISTIAGCGSASNTSGSKGSKILFIMTDVNDTFRKTLSDAVMSAASSQGVSIDMVETGGSLDAEIDLLSSAKEKGYGAVILRPTDNSTALQLNVASSVPIIYVNNQPSDEHLTGDKFIFVGSDEYQAGQYQAEFVAKKLGKKSMDVIIFEGEKGHSGTIGRTSAVKQTLKSLGVTANYVFVDFANWSDTEAAEKFEVFLKTGQNVDAIFCNNDTMALGAIEAMKAHGLDYTAIPVAGVDATADGCASIAAGEMAFTVLQSAEGQASKAVEAAKVLSGGGNLSNIEGVSKDHKYIWVDFEPVDASNVSQYQ